MIFLLGWPIFRGRTVTRWWFQISFIFTPIWGRFPFWIIFSKWVGSTTNQVSFTEGTSFLLDVWCSHCLPELHTVSAGCGDRKRQQSKETVEGEQKSNQAKLDERLGISLIWCEDLWFVVAAAGALSRFIVFVVSGSIENKQASRCNRDIFGRVSGCCLGPFLKAYLKKSATTKGSPDGSLFALNHQPLP